MFHFLLPSVSLRSSLFEFVYGSFQLLSSINNFLSSVRFICGTQDIHKELERKISEFHGTEDTILYGSCFDANGSFYLIF